LPPLIKSGGHITQIKPFAFTQTVRSWDPSLATRCPVTIFSFVAFEFPKQFHAKHDKVTLFHIFIIHKVSKWFGGEDLNVFP
jgi:hypothetical protein